MLLCKTSLHFTCVVEEEEAEDGNEENGPKKTRFSVVNIKNKDPYYETVVRKTHSIFMVRLIEQFMFFFFD